MFAHKKNINSLQKDLPLVRLLTWSGKEESVAFKYILVYLTNGIAQTHTIDTSIHKFGVEY